jgi:hypothetical protein
MDMLISSAIRRLDQALGHQCDDFSLTRGQRKRLARLTNRRAHRTAARFTALRDELPVTTTFTMLPSGPVPMRVRRRPS